MYCRYCGTELPDDAKFCHHCGMPTEVVIKKEMKVVKEERVSFKEAIKRLFTKLFVFSGKTTQREFIFSYLFIFIISTALTSIVMFVNMPSILEAPDYLTMMEEMMNTLVATDDILNPFNLVGLGVTLITVIFLSAPLYRRLTDIGHGKKLNTLLVISYVVVEICVSVLLYCPIPAEIYNVVSPIFSVLSTANTVLLFYCMFRTGQKVLVDEEDKDPEILD